SGDPKECQDACRRQLDEPANRLPCFLLANRTRRLCSHPIYVHRLSDILHNLSAEVVADNRNLVPDLLVDITGDIDAARLRQCLQPGGYIDTVTVEIAALDYHVAKVDTDSQDDTPVVGNAIVRCQ